MNFLRKFNVSVLILSFIFALAPFSAGAEEGDPVFNPAYVLSDAVMNDYNCMSIGDIQNFLQEKGSTLAWYITEDYQGNLKTAAEIIYMAAQQYQVNPKLLLVFLQKEQSLITLTAPTQNRYDWAMGYGVCDSCAYDNPKIQKYKGFGKQVDNAAGAMRFYSNNANVYSFINKAGQTVTITGETFTIQNQATANLYTYTPHIHGNKLFFNLYHRYFGDPTGGAGNTITPPSPPIVLAPPAQTQYKLQIMEKGQSEIWAKEGEVGYYWVEYKNVGSQTWYNQDLNNLYLLKKSDLAFANIPSITDSSLFNNQDSAITVLPKIKLSKTEVKPGEIVRVTIPIDPSYVKAESFDYVLVLGGHGYFPESALSFTLTRLFNYDAQLVSHTYPNTSPINTAHKITVLYKNVGNKAWYKNDTRLEWSNITKDTNNFIQMAEDVVNPGETATFTFTTRPTDPSVYEYSLKMYKLVNGDPKLFPTGSVYPKIAVGVDTVVNNDHLTLAPTPVTTVSQQTPLPTTPSATTTAPTVSAAPTTQTFAPGFAASISQVNMPVSIAKNSSQKITMTFKNIGEKTWPSGQVVLRSYREISPFRGSNFYSSASWVSNMAVAKINKDVKSGESYTFTFYIQAPSEAGSYKHYWQLEYGSQYQEISIDGNFHKDYVTIVQ
ncbi:MAG TPA: NBR1-Ig-like domain-containing protein [bacterium]|nr:NBR1-Ig-like domain-containing protein [bacterium]